MNATIDGHTLARRARTARRCPPSLSGSSPAQGGCVPQNHQCDRYALECAMLGPAKPRRLDEPIAISLAALVPRHNFYLHLEAKLDLPFVREWVREIP
jgi:hypothetical protein